MSAEINTVEQAAYTLQGFGSSAATFAKDVDQAFWINFWMSIVLFTVVIGPMLFLSWKYRASKVKDEDIENFVHHTGLEIAWTAIPTAMLMILFYYGYTSMKVLRTMPDASTAISIDLLGQKWSWQYTYPANANGFVHKTAELYVPENKNIILNMTAPINDVLHSYYVPAFRMKEDVVPGRITKQWFNSPIKGTYDVECAEYCGARHSYMYSKVHVVSVEDYEAWFNSNTHSPDTQTISKGEEALKVNGCKGCHSITTDTKLYGPTLKTRMLTKEQVLNVINNGQEKLAYPMGAMPAGLATGADAQEIAAYVAGGMKGTQPASFAACSSCHGEDGKGQYGTAPSLVSYDVDLLRNVLKNGKKATIASMPAFPNISDEDVSEIAKYLEGMK